MDISKLNEKLGELRGLDFELAEAQERAAGNNFPDVTFTKGFQARLAALALNVPVADIKELPLRDIRQFAQKFSIFYTVLRKTRRNYRNPKCRSRTKSCKLGQFGILDVAADLHTAQVD